MTARVLPTASAGWVEADALAAESRSPPPMPAKAKPAIPSRIQNANGCLCRHRVRRLIVNSGNL
jgi:hypothetical protein